MKRKSRARHLLFLPSLLTIVFASQAVVSAPSIPNPVLYLTGTEIFKEGNKQFIRYKFDVFNKADFPAEMFAPAPDLPPCGKNTKSSRTWVDFYEQNGKRLFGFCAFTKPADLATIWFPVEEGVAPPSWVYIELMDRRTNTKYKSNLADTTE